MSHPFVKFCVNLFSGFECKPADKQTNKLTGVNIEQMHTLGDKLSPKEKSSALKTSRLLCGLLFIKLKHIVCLNVPL